MMRSIDYEGNEAFCKMLVKHDPRMICYVHNYDLEIMRTVLDDSTTHINRVSFHRCKNDSELSKILEYAYSRNASARKNFLEVIDWSLSEHRRPISLDKEIAKRMLTEIFSANPEGLLFMSEMKWLKAIEKDYGVDIKEILLKSKAERIMKRIVDKVDMEEYRPDMNSYDPLNTYASKVFGWSFSNRISPLTSLADNIVLLSEAYGLGDKFTALALYFKLKG
jgi:hypothetical protein